MKKSVTPPSWCCSSEHGKVEEDMRGVGGANPGDMLLFWSQDCEYRFTFKGDASDAKIVGLSCACRAAVVQLPCNLRDCLTIRNILAIAFCQDARLS